VQKLGTPPIAERLRAFGTTIFAEMSALAVRTGSVNLGQGFPDTDGPPEMIEAAVEALRRGDNQYPPGPGIPALREAVARHQRRFYDIEVDPDGEILITAGATEALTSAVLALCDPGDEVIVFEPYYDSYAAAISMAGARRRVVPLRAPDWHFDPDQLAAAVTERTRLLLLNSPHNPTGKVFSRAELEAVAGVCRDHDLLALTDEVYEHLIFDGEHVPLTTLEGMADRTLTVSSAGKTFSFTGWKVGWVCGPEPLVTAVRTAKQFLTYVNAAPLQPAVAVGLDLPDRVYQGIAAELRDRRDQLCAGLSDLGFGVRPPAGTYFASGDIASLPDAWGTDAVEFCRLLPERCGVVAIPLSAFTDRPDDVATLVRFAFCKRPDVLDEALRRMGAGSTGGSTGVAGVAGRP